VFFPGSGAQGASRQNDSQPRFIDFIVKSGRAVIYPTYNSTFERSLKPLPPSVSQAYRDLVIQNAKEVRRTVDYLASRPDIDAEKIAYYGFSWGGREGLNFTALESRFKASILLAAGLDRTRFAPEIDQINFAPRVAVPTLMLNGREDFRFPYEESQLPMFRALGSREKSHVLIKSGHAPARIDIIKPILDWLDKHLGPVVLK
jgi:dipeptidyl aminopeptidase/acylaminoacyl peptidase